jgi:hypothetical protein
MAVSRASEPELDLDVPRKRKTGVVLTIMLAATVLVGVGAIRSVFFKDDDEAKPAVSHVEAAAAARTTTPAEPAVTPAAPSPTVAPEVLAKPAAVAAETTPSAPATGENTAPAAAPSAAVQLAATPSKAFEPAKPRTPQRVEHVRPARPPASRHAHTEAASHAPVSPQLPGGGAIVRQTPF